MKRFACWAFGLIAVGAVGFLLVSTYFAWRFTTPPRRALTVDPKTFLSAYEDVRFPARDGVMLSAWFVPCEQAKGAVVLLHGNGATRTQTLSRAKYFRAQNYAVLLYDARGHGLSDGNLVSFGWYETRDLLGALDWLRARGFEHLGCVGISQGGATIALAAAELAGVRWVILESAFPTLENAVDRRFRDVFGVPGWLAGIFMVPIAEWRLGIDTKVVAPCETIQHLTCPVLVLSGETDRRTFPDDARRVFDHAPGKKTWWLVPGAAHVDLYRVAGKEWESRIAAFLDSVR